MQYSLVYVTTGSLEEASKLAREIVGAKLAACANILGEIKSVYWWEGKLEEGREAALIFKTRSDLVEALTAKIKELHSYSCPCVVALGIEGGNTDFFRWIDKETM